MLPLSFRLSDFLTFRLSDFLTFCFSDVFLFLALPGHRGPADSETAEVSDLGSSGRSAISRPGAGSAPTLRCLPSGPRVLPLPVQRTQVVVGISTRCEAASHHAPGLGRERGEGREEALSSHRGRLRARDWGGEGEHDTGLCLPGFLGLKGSVSSGELAPISAGCLGAESADGCKCRWLLIDVDGHLMIDTCL